MAKMTQAQIDAELKRKASLGIKPTNSANMGRYNQIVSGMNSNKTNTSTSNGTSGAIKQTTGKGHYSNSSSSTTNAYTPPTQQASNPMLNAIKNKVTTGVNALGNKAYTTSAQNQKMYGNNSSTHIIKQSGKLDPNDKRMTVDQHGNWVSDQYGKDSRGTYVLKGGNANNKVYMNDSNKQYFAQNYGGTGNFWYDANNKTTYDEATKAMRTDKNYDIYGDRNKFTPGTNEKLNERIDSLKQMSPAELAEYKKQASMLEQNAISTIDGTFKNDERYNFAPIAIAEDDIQRGLAYMIYNQMGQANGIGGYEGMNTAELDGILNDKGLGGLIDINKLNEPFLLEQQVMQQYPDDPNASLQIDPMEMINEAVRNGDINRFFKEGYSYNPKTGQIEVDPQYTQMGNILADKGEAVRWGNQQWDWANQRHRSEDVNKQMYEEPLEFRAKYAPETMTEEMRADLEQERTLKTQLEELTLQLQYLDELEQGGEGIPMVLAFGGGSGSGSGGSGMGNNNGNTNGMSGYGSGGSSEFNFLTGGGKGAIYGTSQNFNPFVQQEIAKRLGR